MCKYCDNAKRNFLLRYDNTDEMRLCWGQYQGVHAYGEVAMQGNMLMLSCFGRYVSESDCYYSDDDLDNPKSSRDAQESVIQIQYCPFCGKKLVSNTYEVEAAKRKFAQNKELIQELKEKVAFHNVISAAFKYNVKNDIEEIRQKCYGDMSPSDNGYIDARQNANNAVERFMESLKDYKLSFFKKLGIVKYYLYSEDEEQYCKSSDVVSKNNIKLYCRMFYNSEQHYQSNLWRVSEDEILKMIETGTIYAGSKKLTVKKYESIKKEHEKDVAELAKLEAEQVELKKIIKG